MLADMRPPPGGCGGMEWLVAFVLALVASWIALEVQAARVLRRAERQHLASLERQEERRAKGWTGK